MPKVINRMAHVAGKTQMMPFRISARQNEELGKVKQIATAYGWDCYYMPGEYGTLRLICEKDGRTLKASALPARLLLEKGGRPPLLFFHYSPDTTTMKRLTPAHAARAITGKKNP